MFWFNGSRPVLLSDLSLLIELIIFLLLSYSVSRIKVGLSGHSRPATIAFITAFILALFMLYSLSSGFYLHLPPGNQVLMIMHIILGSVTLVLGTLFTTNRWKWKGRKYMRAAFALWAATLVLGLLLYLLLFGYLG